MALFDRFIKNKKAESRYFDQRKTEEPEVTAAATPSHLCLANRRLDKGLIVDLLRLAKKHDVRGTVAIYANTTSGIKKETGIMINKGIVSQKIVAYLQETRLQQIEEGLKIARDRIPDDDGFITIDDQMAQRMNLPSGVVVFPVFSRIRTELGMMLIMRKSVENRRELAKQIVKLIG
jgi:hypothetical protein